MPAEPPVDVPQDPAPPLAHAELHADETADLADDLTNGDLARIFHEIGDILEVKGELVFKTVAYHRAADAIGRSPIDLVAAYRAGDPPKVGGVGQAISDKIAELVTTGRMAFLDRLREEVPASLVDLLRIPGLGPKTVRQLHEELGIATMSDLPPPRRGGSAPSGGCPSGRSSSSSRGSGVSRRSLRDGSTSTRRRNTSPS